MLIAPNTCCKYCGLKEMNNVDHVCNEEIIKSYKQDITNKPKKKLHKTVEKALRLAKRNGQVVGPNSDYFITIEQLNELIK